MSRALAFVAVVGAGAALWWGLRSASVMQPAPALLGEPIGEAGGEAPPAELAPPAAPAIAWTGQGRIPPADVLVIWRQVDPGAWMPAAELLAFVELESGFNPRAYRYEPALREASYGLMQTLASTARDHGLGAAPPEALYDPAVSLRVGINYARWAWEFLRSRLGRDPTEQEWVASYNAGVGNVLRGFIPWSYVRRWQLARDRWRGA